MEIRNMDLFKKIAIAVSENADFGYDAFIRREVENVNSKIKSWGLPFDFQIEYVEVDRETFEEECEDGENVAIALFSMQGSVDTLPIAVNVEYMEQFREENYMSWDEVKDELVVSLWHEVGHGLVQRIIDEYEIEMPFDTDDEGMAEEFGRAKGELNNSKLGKYILKQKKKKWKDWIEY